MRLIRLVQCSALAALVVLSAACDSKSDHVCAAGASVACVGAGGCKGGQVCDADGSGFGVCECNASNDGGAVTDAGSKDAQAPIAEDAHVADASVDAAAADAAIPDMDSATPDSDAAADGVDAAVADCNPFTDKGCAPSERCTWLQIKASHGELACVPNGTVAKGGACTAGADGKTTGYDNCQRGLFCIAGTCARVCDPTDADSCGVNACVQYVGIFSNGAAKPIAGACQPSCNPVTQERTAGGPCGVGKGCYGSGTTFTCQNSDSVLTQDAMITGTAFINSCAPGYVPLKDGAGVWRCTGYCQPVATSKDATAGASGGTPSCTDRGAGASTECLFGSFFSETADPNTDTYGICFDPTGRTYDDDSNIATAEVAIPSCKTLPSTDEDHDGLADNIPFGCAPQP